MIFEQIDLIRISLINLNLKFLDINLQLVRDPGIKPKPNSDSTNPPFVIKLNDSSNEQVLPFGKVWPISSNTEYKGDEATSIGYNEKGVIEKFKESTNKVPQHLPKFISSLFLQHLKRSTQEKIENLDKWDTSNIYNFERCI